MPPTPTIHPALRAVARHVAATGAGQAEARGPCRLTVRLASGVQDWVLDTARGVVEVTAAPGTSSRSRRRAEVLGVMPVWHVSRRVYTGLTVCDLLNRS